MAHGIKYRLEYKNFEGKLQRVDFLFRNYAGPIETVIPGASPFIVQRNKETSGQDFGGITIAKYQISAISSPTFKASSFLSENYGDVLIAKYTETLLYENLLECYGVIIAFECRDYNERAGTYEVNIVAECGLSYLKTVEYKGTSFYTGRTRLIDVITNCLEKIPLPTTFPVRSINNTRVYEGDVELEAKDFYSLYTDNEGFKKSTYQYTNCFEVLSDTIGPLSEIFFQYGSWHIRNIPELMISAKTSTPTTETLYINGLEIGFPTTYTPQIHEVGTNIIAFKNALLGNYLSQRNITINQKSGFLANWLTGSTFKHTSGDILGWSRETSFSSSEVGGQGTLADPCYFRINESIHRPSETTVDTQYLESEPVYFQPYGVELPDAFGNSKLYIEEDLKITGKLELSPAITNTDIQIIIGNPVHGFVYYYNNNNEWSRTPSFYTISITKPLGTFEIEIADFPNDLHYFISPAVLFEPVPVIIRLFRGNRLGESIASIVDYHVKYFEIAVARVGREVEKEVYKEENRTFWVDKTADKAKTSTISVGLGNTNYPYAYGAIYNTADAQLGIEQFGLFGTTDKLPYNYYIAHAYLKIFSKRLRFFEGDVQGIVEHQGFLLHDGILYRPLNLSINTRMNQTKIKAMEMAISLDLPVYNNLNREQSKQQLKPSVDQLVPNRNKDISVYGDNFKFEIDSTGRRQVKVSDDLTISSITSRTDKLSIGDATVGTLTEILGRFGIKSTNNFLGEFLIGENTEDRAYSFPDRDIEVNQWNDLSDVPESFPPDATCFKTDYGMIGAHDGVNTIFQTIEPFVLGSTKVYLNGVRQFKGVTADYQELSDYTIEMSIAPEANDRLIIDYIKST